MKNENIKGKVIGVGFQKTGTSSLREALKLLGYKVCDTKWGLLFPVLNGNWDKILRVIQKYDAVEDNPWPLIYKELDERIPGCKFILTVRDTETWYNSVSKHIGDLRDPMHEWIYGVGKGLPKYHKENTIRVYEEHNEEVRKYFRDRPNDFIELDFTKGDAWEELCGFLGDPIPGTPFPHFNKAGKNKGKPRKKPFKRRLKLAKKRTKYYLTRKYLESRNLSDYQ